MAGDGCRCKESPEDYCCPTCGHDWCGECEEGMLHQNHEDKFADEVCDACCNGSSGCPDYKR